MDEVKPYKGSYTTHRVDDFAGGFDPLKGFYISNILLDAPWEEDLSNLRPMDLECHPHYHQHMEDRNFNQIFQTLSLRSIDGEVTPTQPPPGQDEDPNLFYYTDAYHNSPVLKRVCDWFQFPVSRIRLFSQQPGQTLQFHHDFDNERTGFDPNNVTIRVIMALGDYPDAWYRLANESVDVTFRLVRGQFIILNTDATWHATVNNGEVARHTLNFIGKRSEWIENLVKPKDILEIERVQV